MNEPVHIYRITALENLPMILGDRGMHCGAEHFRKKKPYTAIGIERLTRERADKEIPCGPRGVMGDYVHFYFCHKSPMLYLIDRKNPETWRRGQEEVIYLVSSVQHVTDAGHQFVFTDRHAKVAHAKFFDDVTDLQALDWETINAKWWNDTDEDPDRSERKQAEFHVYKFVPWDLIRGIGVHNAGVKDRVQAILDEKDVKTRVQVKSGWYY